MVKTILVATDGSDTAENAATFAVDLANQLNCSIYAIYVADAVEYIAGMKIAEMYLAMHESILKHIMDEAEAAVKKIEDMAAHKGVTCTTEVVKGSDPVKEIIDAARKKNADLIVVGSHGKKTSLIDLAIGEIPPKLMAADLPCPLTIVKPN